MASPIMSTKVVVVSTAVIIAMFSFSWFPNLWSSFLSWLKPPYLFVTLNVIVLATIVASSKYFQSTGDQDCEVKEVDMDGPFVSISPPPIVVTDVERSEVVCEEKEEEMSELNYGGDELVMLTRKLSKVPTITYEPETKKPLVSARSSHLKPVKVTSKCNKRKAPSVVKPKWHENTWKMMVTKELKSTPVTSHSWRYETLGLAAREAQPVLRESKTFRDITNNYPVSPTVTQPVKMRKEKLPNLEELNRKFEAFIKKGKEEILESRRLDKEVDLEGRLITL